MFVAIYNSQNLLKVKYVSNITIFHTVQIVPHTQVLTLHTKSGDI